MKYTTLFIAALTSLTLAGCSKNTQDKNINTLEYRIGFERKTEPSSDNQDSSAKFLFSKNVEFSEEFLLSILDKFEGANPDAKNKSFYHIYCYPENKMSKACIGSITEFPDHVLEGSNKKVSLNYFSKNELEHIGDAYKAKIVYKFDKDNPIISLKSAISYKTFELKVLDAYIDETFFVQNKKNSTASLYVVK